MSEQAEPVWVVECHNEWCSGPEKVAVLDERPDEPYPCPTCGWPAMHSSGIKRVPVGGEDE